MGEGGSDAMVQGATEEGPSKLQMIRGEGTNSLYKSEEKIDSEFVDAHELTFDEFRAAGFLGKNRNYFI